MGRLWDVRSSKVSASIKMKEQAFLFLAWSPGDPNIVATVQQESNVYFIDLRKQKVLKVLQGKGTRVSLMACFCCMHLFRPCILH